MNENSNTLIGIVSRQRNAVEAAFQPSIVKLNEIAAEFGMAEVGRKLDLQYERLTSSQLEVMVAGRFKVGKSTFLNALLCSTSHALASATMNAPLPVDALPCTAVLTRIEYASEPRVHAVYFDGREEEWSFAEYAAEARIYGEKFGHSGSPEAPGRLAQIRAFTIGLPVDLLRSGLVFVDSPGISEDPRRTALTREALSSVHAAILMFRSDMLAGEDELDFAAEVLEQTSHAFPVVNMFHGQPVTDRFKAVLADRLGRIQGGEGSEKLNAEAYYVDCRKAHDGYVAGDMDLIRRSGILPLERQIGAFVIERGYHAKATSAIEGTRALIGVMSETLSREAVAVRAERDQLRTVLDGCETDMREIRQRRARVQTILGRTADRLVAEAGDSYRAMCRDLDASIDRRFAERPLRSLSSMGGKLSALFGKTAAREAGAILQDIVQGHVRGWAEAPPTARGLQRDLLPAMQTGRHELEQEYQGIDSRLRDISVRIGSLDTVAGKAATMVGLQERMLAAGLGMAMLGPVGLVVGATGWRGAVGATLGVLGAKAGLALLAGALGVAFAPAVLIALVLSAVLGGAFAGGVHDLEGRIRRKALEAMRPRLRAMMTDQAALDDLTQSLRASLEEEAAQILSALDVVLGQQEESLASLRAAKGRTLAERQARLETLAEAQSSLAAVRHSLGELSTGLCREAPALAA